jgi:hypothetical protein
MFTNDKRSRSKVVSHLPSFGNKVTLIIEIFQDLPEGKKYRRVHP